MRAAALVIALCVATTSFARNSTSSPPDSASSGPEWGIGISVSDTWPLASMSTAYGPIGLSEIHIPLLLNRRLCIEPSFGILRRGTSNEGASSVLRAGLGALFVRGAGRTRFYSGPRVAMMAWSDDNDESWIDYWFAAVTGAEHAISEHLSVGGEVQLTYSLVGDGTRADESYLTTRGLILLRWYYKRLLGCTNP